MHGLLSFEKVASVCVCWSRPSCSFMWHLLTRPLLLAQPATPLPTLAFLFTVFTLTSKLFYLPLILLTHLTQVYFSPVFYCFKDIYRSFVLSTSLTVNDLAFCFRNFNISLDELSTLTFKKRLKTKLVSGLTINIKKSRRRELSCCGGTKAQASRSAVFSFYWL